MIAAPKEIACGEEFVVVLLENRLLVRVEADGRKRVLFAKKTGVIGGARFVAVSASNTYAIAVDEDGNAWIFGSFNRFPQRTLGAAPVFQSVRKVFAFREYAVAVTEGFLTLGIGKLPNATAGEKDCENGARPILHGVRTNYIAGNDKEFGALPLYYSYEEALQITEKFIPGRVLMGLTIG
jgi:hypothetical protein